MVEVVSRTAPPIPLHHKPAVSKKMRDFVPPFGRAAPFIVVLLGALSCVFVFRLIAAGIYDWMLMSGCAFVILGIVLSQGLPDRLEHALDRLVDRGALAVNPERLESFKLRLEAWIARYWAPCGGSIVAVAVAAAFVAAFDIAELEDRRFLLAGEILGGYFVGCYLGRMACYGSLGYLLSHERIRVSIIPGHLDTVGGLKPVGDYFLRQAMIVGLPGVFTGAWLVLMRFMYFSHYQVWRAPYVGLLFVAILFEITSFIAPLWWFHREMTRQNASSCMTPTSCGQKSLACNAHWRSALIRMK